MVEQSYKVYYDAAIILTAMSEEVISKCFVYANIPKSDFDKFVNEFRVRITTLVTIGLNVLKRTTENKEVYTKDFEKQCTELYNQMVNEIKIQNFGDISFN